MNTTYKTYTMYTMLCEDLLLRDKTLHHTFCITRWRIRNKKLSSHEYMSDTVTLIEASDDCLWRCCQSSDVALGAVSTATAYDGEDAIVAALGGHVWRHHKFLALGIGDDVKPWGTCWLAPWLAVTLHSFWNSCIRWLVCWGDNGQFKWIP